MSTASMGRFDKKLEGEKKLRGVKRKVCSSPPFLPLIGISPCFQFEPTEMSVEKEQKANLKLISSMESDAKKMRKAPQAEDSVINVRKAIRGASKGQGAAALGRSESKGKGSKGKGRR